MTKRNIDDQTRLADPAPYAAWPSRAAERTSAKRWAKGVALAVALVGSSPVWAANKADAEFVAGWDAIISYCSGLQPGQAARYQAGVDSVFKSASPAMLADARMRAEYKPRFDATVKQLKKSSAGPLVATCNAWTVAVNGVNQPNGDRKQPMPVSITTPK